LQAVAENELLAITAIKDMEQEGAIAAALIRAGWRVVYRATSPEHLDEKLTLFSGAVLLLSDDFIAAEEVRFEGTLLLRGRSQPLGKMGISAPRSDFELGELLRSRSIEETGEKVLIPATESSVIAFISTQGGVGTTTLALNVAEQISILGKKVLLVDSNINSPSISEHCEIHDIRSQAKELLPKLSLFEISNLEELVRLAAIAEDFDFILMDLGLMGEFSISGARVGDRIFQWILHSQGRFILTSGSSRKSIERMERTVKRAREIAPALKLDLAITLDRTMSRRERIKIEADISESSSCRVATFSRDPKGISAARERASTLMRSAPRSVVNREIAQYVKEQLIQE
jgi:hypothetical protein